MLHRTIFPRLGGQVFNESIIGRTEPQTFKSPYNIVQDSRGLISVADCLDANLCVYDIMAWTVEYYSEEAIFTRLADLAITAGDTIYVTDRLNRRFSMWRYFSEKYLQEHPLTAAEQASREEVGRSVVAPQPAAVEEVKSP